MGSEKRYVYGIIEAEPLELDVDGVNGADTAYTVEYQKHAAVVSDIETMDPEQTDENATAHDEVLRTVMTHGDGRTVVPMQFGMVFESNRALKNVLRSGRLAFTRALRKVSGNVELGVKAVAPEDGDVDTEALRDTAEAELDPLSVNVAEGDQFSDRLVLNRSYLVERENQAAFDDAVDRVREADEAATIQYSGPWAPYNFVDIEIGVKQ